MGRHEDEAIDFASGNSIDFFYPLRPQHASSLFGHWGWYPTFDDPIEGKVSWILISLILLHGLFYTPSHDRHWARSFARSPFCDTRYCDTISPGSLWHTGYITTPLVPSRTNWISVHTWFESERMVLKILKRENFKIWTKTVVELRHSDSLAERWRVSLVDIVGRYPSSILIAGAHRTLENRCHRVRRKYHASRDSFFDVNFRSFYVAWWKYNPSGSERSDESDDPRTRNDLNSILSWEGSAQEQGRLDILIDYTSRQTSQASRKWQSRVRKFQAERIPKHAN